LYNLIKALSKGNTGAARAGHRMIDGGYE